MDIHLLVGTGHVSDPLVHLLLCDLHEAEQGDVEVLGLQLVGEVGQGHEVSDGRGTISFGDGGWVHNN